MPKHFINDLTGGLVKDRKPHQLQQNELSEAQNIRYRDGLWQERLGYSLPFTATGDGNEVVEIADYIRNDGTTHLVCATTDRIYRLNGTTWDQKKNLAPTASATDKAFFAEADDNLFFTNGVDGVQSVGDISSSNLTDVSWDTSNDADGNSGRNISTAKVILTFNERLLLFNTDDTTDGAVPNRMMWTEVRDYDRVESNNFNDLNISATGIISAKVLGNGLIAVYKPDMIYTVQDTGSPLFFVPRFSRKIGLMAAKAVTEIPQGNFFVSNTGFYIFQGGGLISVGDEQVTSYFFDQLDITYKDNVYCFTDWLNREVHIMYPDSSATNGEPNRKLIYNWQETPTSPERWSEDTYESYCGFYQFRTVTTPVIYHGTTSGNVKQETGSTDNSTAISTKLHTHAFHILPDPNNPDPPTTVRVTKILIDAEPTGINATTVKVSCTDLGGDTFKSSDSPIGTYTSSDISDVDGLAPYAQIKPVSGRYATIAAEDFNSISEIIMWWNGDGHD